MMNLNRLKKEALVNYCTSLGLDSKGLTKAGLIEAIIRFEREEILAANEKGKADQLLRLKIGKLADNYQFALKTKVDARIRAMKSDDNSHHLVYRVLGISESEGYRIDRYQNTGRFLYKYAGSFLEEAASLCLKFKNIDGGKTTIANTAGSRPKTFEIDFLNGKDAIEIKWRDATTDGDHITKEHTRVKVIESHGYTPIRIMFYLPQRKQAQRIQETLKTIYAAVKGQYYAGPSAWKFLKTYTGFDLHKILVETAEKSGQK